MYFGSKRTQFILCKKKFFRQRSSFEYDIFVRMIFFSNTLKFCHLSCHMFYNNHPHVSYTYILTKSLSVCLSVCLEGPKPPKWARGSPKFDARVRFCWLKASLNQAYVIFISFLLFIVRLGEAK